MPKNLTSYALYLLITVLVVSLYLGDFTGLKKVQWKIDDLMYTFRGEQAAAPEIVLVNIDDESCDKLGHWPWSYDRLADLVATCNTGEPRTILLNVDLVTRVSEDTSGNTKILANQLSWVNNMVLTYDMALAEYSHHRMSKPDYLFQSSVRTDTELGVLDEDAALNVRRPFLPSGILLQYTDGLGFTYMDYDHDRRVRRVPMLANYDGFYYPSAPLLAAALQLGFKPDDITVASNMEIRFGNYTIPIDENGRFFINYSNPESAFREYAAVDLLEEKVNLESLKDKLVIIGVTATGAADVFNTPVMSSMPRSTVYANIIENIMHGNYVKRLDFSSGLNALILFGFGLFCAVILPRVTLLYRMIILFVCLFILANLGFILFNSYNILINSLYLAIEILLFILAAPLLDESRFSGNSMFDFASLFGRRSEKAKMDFSTAPDLKRTPVKELRDSGDDPDFQETEHIEQMSDRPAKTADPVSETASMDSAPLPDSSPRPIEPPQAAIPEWQTGIPISEHMKLEQNRQQTAHPEQEVPIEPQDAPRPSEPDLSASPLSGTGGDKDLTHLGRYEVKGVIGKGAMGTVFKGIDPAINRPVALKTIRLDFVSDQSEMEELRERLMREARAAGKLSHPNIVTIYDIGSQENLQYIAMEYLEGKTLEDMIKRKVQFSYKIIASIITQICTALQYAHDQGIVHRDVKPANIMVLPDYTVKVMDFGIARVDSSSMTRTGIAMGTPNYIAPELLQGKPVDRRCDIYSVGVVIYEMLTGRRPFKGENLTSLIYSIINDNPPSPSKINENIPLLFDHIVDRALKKDPLERYQKASDLKSALSDFIGSFSGPSKVNI